MDDRATAVRIGLLWHSLTSGNLGVGALTVANLALAREAASAVGRASSFVVIGMRDGDSPPVAGPADGVDGHVIVDRRSLMSPGGVMREIADLDLVLDIGAGDSWAEIYGPKRFAFLWATKAMALARGVPLILSPQTIGPFESQAYARAAGAIMDRAAAVVARDAASFAALRRVAPNARALQATDVAFALPWIDRSAERGGERVRVGVNVSGLLWHQAVSGRNRFGLSYDYAAAMREILTRWGARDDLDVVLVPHATSGGDPADDDGALAERLAAELPGVRAFDRFDSPGEAKSAISSLDFLVAARMHASIAAFGAGVPVVPVAYSRKFAGLYDTLGYPHVLPATGLDEDAVVDRLDDALADRALLASASAPGRAEADARLEPYRALLRETIAALP